MLKICLGSWESEPQYAYKRYAYKKNMYLENNTWCDQNIDAVLVLNFRELDVHLHNVIKKYAASFLNHTRVDQHGETTHKNPNTWSLVIFTLLFINNKEWKHDPLESYVWTFCKWPQWLITLKILDYYV